MADTESKNNGDILDTVATRYRRILNSLNESRDRLKNIEAFSPDAFCYATNDNRKASEIYQTISHTIERTEGAIISAQTEIENYDGKVYNPAPLRDLTSAQFQIAQLCAAFEKANNEYSLSPLVVLTHCDHALNALNQQTRAIKRFLENKPEITAEDKAICERVQAHLAEDKNTLNILQNSFAKSNNKSRVGMPDGMDKQADNMAELSRIEFELITNQTTLQKYLDYI